MGKYSLRSSEKKEFAVWLAERNTAQARLAGTHLAIFALAAAIASRLGLLDYPPRLYMEAFAGVALGLAILILAKRLEKPRVSRAGELFMIGTAIFWTFRVVLYQTAREGGLAEFVIGTLALAMLRHLSPKTAIVVFTGFGALYGGILYSVHAFELGRWMSGLAFCCFAAIWSKQAYDSCIIEFRNRLILDQLKEKNRHLDSLTLQDSLTGLPNRRYFTCALERCWSDPALAGQSIALIMLDIDHFKEYNDKHGHPAGDVCLQRVAQGFSSVLRAGGSAIRIGGEEFAVILEKATSDDAFIVARRLTEAVRLDGIVTASAGVAAMVPPAGTPKELYSRADGALYKAKNSGRDRIERA